ncbi:MAG TPA: VWA domain-containing protein [Vicinamibacterales bacterium]|nr:VWA domain-containing protein [Vicinamibacterales bacterium]
MLPSIDFSTLSVATPLYLWLLLVPAALFGLWIWQLARRRADTNRLARTRLLPVRQRFGLVGDLGFWLAVIVASALCIVALAGPRARVSVMQRASTDVVVLLDGSASMYTRDVSPDRWRRSVRFLRAFAEALGWRGDRVALALFAHTAAPQVRLTKDPNALFFFLDHLGDHSPFRLEDAPTWDTNIEEGLRWGLRLIEKDEQLFGKSRNPKAFVVITDGQSWSGSVASALQEARQRNIPVYVVGVGTTAGAMIPNPPNADVTQIVNIRAVLDRTSLLQIAVAGGGEYFEIGHEPDRDVAFRIIDRLQHRDAQRQQVDTYEELYWRLLLAAGVVLCAGTLLLHTRTELAGQIVAAGGVLLLLSSLI